MRIIDGRSDQLIPFIEALGLKTEGLQHVKLEVGVEGIMEVTTTYKQFVEEGDLKKLVDVVSKWTVCEQESVEAPQQAS